MDSSEAAVLQASEKREAHHRESSPASIRKRTRASTEQLLVLESVFERNVSPNTKLRKKLAEQLQMRERSIQIWFQNRRAKVKHMQRKAQIQMEHAAIQAQLQHYHEQQCNMMASLGVAHTPLPYSPYPILSPQPQQYTFYFSTAMPMTRAQSAGAISYQGGSVSSNAVTYSLPTPGPDPYISFGPENQGYSTVIDDTITPPIYENTDSSLKMPRKSMPPLSSLSYKSTNTDTQPKSKSTNESLSSQGLLRLSPCQNDFPNYIHGQISPSSTSSAGFSSRCNSFSHSLSSFAEENEPVSTNNSEEKTSPLFDIAASSDVSKGNLTLNTTAVSQVSPIFTLGEDTTVIPSSSVLTSPFACLTNTSQSQRFNAETLTVGTWHRINLPPSDLLCLFEINQNAFVWVINEGGSQFKVEIPLTHITRIECSTCVDINNGPTSDIHFYLSQIPSFYLDMPTEHGRQWVECSDFTQDQQASRHLLHTLRGSPELVQDLLNLLHKKDELQSIVHFIDSQYSYDALQTVYPISIPILPSQHQYSTATAPSTDYYIDSYPSLSS